MQRQSRRQRGTPQTNRTATIGFRVEPHVKDAAEFAAARDHRSLSSLMEKILIEFLGTQGLLARVGRNS
jgi:predicted HicB family RNase H-like nuclease